MAKRCVFTVTEKAPYYEEHQFEIDWSHGTSNAQMRKNIEAIHGEASQKWPDKKVLEISSYSEEEAGISASAFNLEMTVPSVGKKFKTECVYQSAKVFSDGGPYTDLLDAAPGSVKKDKRLKNNVKNDSGEVRKLMGFRYEGADYALTDGLGFYDYIYILALRENPDIAKKIAEYDAFTDIAFNSTASKNCQARSAAVFTALYRMGKIDEVTDYASFLSLTGKESSVVTQIEEGDTIRHKVFGEGTVSKVIEKGEGDWFIVVKFKARGEKTIQKDWVALHCEVVKKKKSAK